jgi:hypothetical protein
VNESATNPYLPENRPKVGDLLIDRYGWSILGYIISVDQDLTNPPMNEFGYIVRWFGTRSNPARIRWHLNWLQEYEIQRS